MEQRLLALFCPSFLGATHGILPDISGNNNNASLVNMDRNTAWVADPGKVSVNFNATTQFINAVFADAINLATDEVTISFWNLNPFGTSGVYAALANATNGTPFLIFQNSVTSLAFANRSNVAGDSSAIGGAWQTAVWRNLVGVSTPTSLSLFQNGVRIATTARTAAATTLNQITLGALNRAGSISNFALSSIDDVRIYRRALGPDEIGQIYGRDRGGGLLHEPPKNKTFFVPALPFPVRRRSSRFLGFPG